VQISRMRDGVRRITQVSEIVGMEGEIITMQDLFSFQYQSERADGTLIGRHVCTEFRPRFVTRAQYYGLAEVLLEAVGCRMT
jgi:pilus assembly protein CpaF